MSSLDYNLKKRNGLQLSKYFFDNDLLNFSKVDKSEDFIYINDLYFHETNKIVYDIMFIDIGKIKNKLITGTEVRKIADWVLEIFYLINLSASKIPMFIYYDNIGVIRGKPELRELAFNSSYDRKKFISTEDLYFRFHNNVHEDLLPSITKILNY